VRDEVTTLVDQGGALDVPEGFSEVASQMSEADRALMLVYSRIYHQPGVDRMREMIKELGRTPLDEELDALAADADDATREALARRYAPYLADIRRRWGWIDDPMQHARHSAAQMRSAVIGTLLEVYSAAQLDVIARANRIIDERTAAMPGARGLPEGQGADSATPSDVGRPDAAISAG